MGRGWKKSMLLLGLALCLTLAAFPGRARAAEPGEEDYLYYSDIFWGYPGALTDQAFLLYRLDLNNTLTGVLDEYVYTDAFEASVVELGITYGTDWGKFAKYLADEAFGTSFNLNDRIDEANKLVAEAFLNVNYLQAANEVGAPKSFLKGLKYIAGTIEKIDGAGAELDGLTGEALSSGVSGLVHETCGWMAEGGGTVAGVLLEEENVFLDLVKTIADTADKTKDAVDFLKALAVSVAMSDAQLDMIQSVLDTQEPDSMLYRGMKRLQDQLADGYRSYFVSTYLTDEIYKQVTELLGDCLKDGSLILGSAAYRAATAVVKLVNWVVFDLVWKVDYNDYAVAVVLYQYCNDFSDSIQTKARAFTGQFEDSDVEEYENLYKAYLSTGRAALEHFEKLARYNSEKDMAYLEEARSRLCGADVSADYNAYIDAIRTGFVQNSAEWRESMKAPHPYTVEGDMTASSQGADQMEEGILYFVDGVYEGDISINSSARLTVPAEERVTVLGGLEVAYSGVVYNHGDLEVTGGIQLEYDYASSGTIAMEEAEAVLRLGGDFYGERSGGCAITGGTVVFNGTRQQAVRNLTACNVEVTNPAGLLYESPMYLYGHYDLNGNPLAGVNAWNRTMLYGTATLEPGEANDYQNVVLQEDNQVLFGTDGVYRCDLSVSSAAALTVPAGAEVTVLGELEVAYSGAVYNHGDLEVTGGVLLEYDYASSGTIAMEEAEAVLRLGGDFYGERSGSCAITGGTVVFNGTRQQTVNCLKTAATVILENKSSDGVVFYYPITISVLFDHRGNAFTLYSGGSGSSFPDYDGDGLLDHVDPEPTVPRKAEASLEDGVVTVRLYDAEGCASVVIAAYAPEGRLLEVRVRQTDGEVLREPLSPLPEGGYLKIFYLAEQYVPWTAMEVLTE